jgi:hypothetical protein
VLLEKALLISSILGLSVVGVQTVLGRTLKAKMATFADGAAQAHGAPRQYEPYYQEQDATSAQTGSTTVTASPGGGVKKDDSIAVTVDPGAEEITGVGRTRKTREDSWQGRPVPVEPLDADRQWR